MEKVYIYARISQDTEQDSHGVKSQLKQCEEWVHARGWEVSGTYVDNDISAYSGVERPQFEQLVRDMAAGDVAHLVVWHVDRLARRVADLQRIIDAALKGGVEIHTVKAGEIDISNASGELMALMLGAVAQFEARHLSERQLASRADRIKRGLWVGGKAPFGYRLKGKGVLEINESEAAFIREWCDQLLQGKTLFELVKRTKQAVKHDPENALNKIALQSLKSRVLNPTVAGLIRSKGEIVGKGNWEPIIPAEKFFELQTLLTDPARRTNQGVARMWQGSGVYRCGKCGDICRVKKARQKNRRTLYICKNDCVSVGQEDLDNLVNQVILGYLSREENRLEFAGSDKDNGEQARSLQRRREQLAQRKEELSRLFMRGGIDAAQLEAATEEFNKTAVRIEAELAEMKATSPVMNLLFGSSELAKGWERLGPDNRAAVIKELIEVTIHPANSTRRESVEQRVSIRRKGA